MVASFVADVEQQADSSRVRLPTLPKLKNVPSKIVSLQMSLCCLGYSAGFLRQYVMIPLSEHHSAFSLTLRGQEIRFGSEKD